MRFFILVMFAVLSIASGPVRAEIAPDKLAAIKEMMALIKMNDLAKAMGDQVAKMTVESLKQKQPPVDPKIIAIVEDEVKKFTQEEMTKDSFSQMIYPIYDKYFTTAELNDIIAFYKTSSGSKALSVMPQLMQESMTAGQQWAQGLVPVLQKRLQDRVAKETAAPQ